jgi:uncharacterized protein (UPF0210 family)
MDAISRREFVSACGAAALVLPDGGPHARAAATQQPGGGTPPRCRVRTLTAGVTLEGADDVRGVETALTMLESARKVFRDEGYEVQTIRVATQPLAGALALAGHGDAIPRFAALDAAAAARGAVLSLGPILTDDRADAGLAQWAADLIAATRATSLSVVVASPAGGVHLGGARVAAEAILAISKATSGGAGNFRFAAAANIPAGTPFFPVAWHRGPDALAVGLESAGLVRDAFASGATPAAKREQLGATLTSALAPVERLASRLASEHRRAWLGIDASPAPGKDASIGAAIEAFTGVPFGDATTLQACAVITEVLKALPRTCGYSGLMLPVLEDPVLAERAVEHRYSLRDLLLYSSVCGTGLDVVPLPGDTLPSVLAGVLTDVAALSDKWRKPLSARLFVMPGKKPGDSVHFDDPLLADCVVFDVR